MTVRAPRRPHVPDLTGVLRTFRVAARETAWREIESFAVKQTEDFKERIKDQDFEDFTRAYYPSSPYWNKNLSPRWFRRKRKAGADTRTMLATHWYLRHIRVWTRMYQRVRVGFHPKAKARNLKGKIVPATLNLVARVHEFGSVKCNIPRRSHWGPHFARMHAAAIPLRRRIARMVAAEIRKKAR